MPPYRAGAYSVSVSGSRQGLGDGTHPGGNPGRTNLARLTAHERHGAKNGESGTRGATSARRTAHTPRRPATTHARHAAVQTSPRACSAPQCAHTSARHPCGRRDPVSQGRALLRGPALGWRSGTPPRRIHSQHRSPAKGSRHASASLLPQLEKMRLLALLLRRRYSARPYGPRINRLDRRPHRADASARSWCTLLHTHACRNVRKAPWSACKAARSGGARTASPGQVAPRGPDSPTLTPWRTRRLSHAAGAADRPL